MISTTLIVPGLRGSGPDHWQTWFEHRIGNAVRVEQSNWCEPVLEVWAGNVRRAIDRAKGPIWMVGHSFGCLAAMTAVLDRGDRIAGALLVAPADPDRFTPNGLRDNNESTTFAPSILRLLPDRQVGFPSVLIASQNDPWLGLMSAAYLADRWGSRLLNIGNAGHINVDSGHGPWPQGLAIFRELQVGQGALPLGSLADPKAHRRFSNLRTRRLAPFDWRNYIERGR